MSDDRPKSRSECVDYPRPCPYVSCRYHLYLDVKGDNIKINFPGVEVEDLKHSCAIDLADEGAKTLDEVAETLNVTRERVRQIETKALLKLRKKVNREELQQEEREEWRYE